MRSSAVGGQGWVGSPCRLKEGVDRHGFAFAGVYTHRLWLRLILCESREGKVKGWVNAQAAG